MSARIYVHEFDKPDVDLGADAIIVFERSDGAKVRVSFDADGEIDVYNEDGRIAVEPRSGNVVRLKPHNRAVEVAARRVRKVLGKLGYLGADSAADVRTLIEAALR